MKSSIVFEQVDLPHCPYCNSVLDAHRGMDGNCLPMTGDVSICFNCANLLVYEIEGGNIDLRKPTPEEQSDFDNDEYLTKIISSLKQLKKNKFM